MTDFLLYNTLTRSVERFEPADGETVRMYTCGPTVYDPAHLGNFRTFLFEDLLHRALEYAGWKVKQIMNLTDVDDKIIKRAYERGVTIDQVTEPMVEVFHRDREFLRIRRADAYPKATEHVPEMIDLLRQLIDRGLAYQAEDGSLYFAIARFPSYGKLSRLDLRQIQPGARVAADDYNKEDVRDFALWKAAKPEDEATGAVWESPWGRGRPGWHLECSAMSMKYLGKTLDIHCGGVDNIFPHHEDEIAQSEGATGAPFSRFWCHGEFLLTDGAKMAKRVGNVLNVGQLRDAGYGAAAIRHLVFSTHYRQQLNVSEEALAQSTNAVQRIGSFADRLERGDQGIVARAGDGRGAGLSPRAEDDRPDAPTELGAIADEALARVRDALFHDLNAPQALEALFTFIRRANAALDVGAVAPASLERARAAFATIDSLLDLTPAPVDDPAVASWVEERLAARAAARATRDFGAADRIRAELEAAGVSIEDTPGGTRWRKVR
ncbi:MAG TPA: cysteine--tRNA ligase [Gemmatimonadaceae bacterium]|nr:cysteine--tRNA ligase [Gemmatimonadaceae bacterium]